MYYCIGLWASRATKWWYAAMTDQTCINNRHHHSLDNVMWMKESKQQGMLTVVGENNVSQQVVEDSRTAVEGTLCHTNNHHTIIASRPSWHRQRTTTHTAHSTSWHSDNRPVASFMHIYTLYFPGYLLCNDLRHCQYRSYLSGEVWTLLSIKIKSFAVQALTTTWTLARMLTPNPN